MTLLVLLQQAAEPAWPSSDGLGAVRGLVSVAVVIALLGLFVWLVRRGTFGGTALRRSAAVSVETAVPLGERRSLVIVTVDGRRLLLGLTPMQVSVLTELVPRPPAFDSTLDAQIERHRESVQ
jgi:flagellar protein FliO/FliZ